MPTPFSEAAADAVATALNAANLGYTFSRVRYPKYSLKDIKAPKTHVVPVWPARLDPHDGEGSATETPIAVTIDAACEKGDDATIGTLTGLLETIAVFLARTDIAGLGYPIEPLVIDRNEDMLDQGHFCGGVGAVYRVYREHPEDDE
jgi:hypothetical protein